jgi:hemoglobin
VNLLSNLFLVPDKETSIMMNRSYVTKACLGAIVFSGAVALAAINFSSSVSAQDKPGRTAERPATPTMTQSKSLYDRLGGTYAIAAVIDDFVSALPKNGVIMANPQTKASIDKAAASNGLPGLKYQITAFVIQATGGPYKYHGKTMLESHKNLKINESEWAAGVEALKATLTKFKVPAKEQEELIAIVATTHDDIVENGASGSGMR